MPESTTTTIQGDTWDGLTKRLWGEERRMHLLMEANPAHQGTLIFSAGVVLKVPDAPNPATVPPLPPWRKSK